MRHIVFIVALLSLISATSHAGNDGSEARHIATYQQWNVSIFFDRATKSCVISNQGAVSQISKDKKNKSEGVTPAINTDDIDAFLFITNWPERKEYLAISARTHILLKKNKNAWLVFPNNQRFPLQQNAIDAKPNPRYRADILNLLRNNPYVEIVNYTNNGQEVRKYYDLQGIDNALAALIRFCPLPP